jgi:hypothetical protein
VIEELLAYRERAVQVERDVPGRIYRVDRAIAGIDVAAPINGVALQERAGAGVVGAGPQVLQAGLGVGPLAGEADLVGQAAGAGPGGAEGGVVVAGGGVARWSPTEGARRLGLRPKGSAVSRWLAAFQREPQKPAVPAENVTRTRVAARPGSASGFSRPDARNPRLCLRQP